uniref:Family with sequence similarity 169 member Ab n=1 Tax=Astyanax mexicanus TaxID=7994 RepID=A0A8B9KWS8_ASTMX
MEFPVDVLEAIGHEELESSAHSYMSDLLYVDPDHSQYLSLTTGRKVRISLSNVGFVPLYGANLKHKVLALFAPEDQFTAVALLLDDKWYAVDDILRTADSSREGLIKVRSVGERIVLYVLNRIVYRTSEMSAGEVPFLCHGENDFAKILWKNGEAVGFYSVKPKGSLCSNFVSQCYLLPVMDSIFVRRGHRGQGHGLQMLEDFVDSFKDDELGMKFPLSPAMSQVCRHYLDRYPADVDLLWEVEGVGGPYQRTRVASKLSTHTLKVLNIQCLHLVTLWVFSIGIMSGLGKTTQKCKCAGYNPDTNHIKGPGVNKNIVANGCSNLQFIGITRLTANSDCFFVFWRHERNPHSIKHGMVLMLWLNLSHFSS